MSTIFLEKPPAPAITQCVLYVRVSSRKQVTEGSGLQSQITRCRDFAVMKGFAVDNVFLDEGVSGGELERPGMQQLLAFLREHSTEANPYAVIFDDISRLARGTRVHENLRDAIYEADGVLFSPTQRFGKDADSRMTEMVQATVAQHFREKNAETTRNRLMSRWKDGYYTAIPPVGYKYKAVKGRGKMLIPNEPIASYVREAFEGLSSGRFHTATEVKRFLETKPDYPRNRSGNVRLSTVIEMVRRSTYAGFLCVKSRGIHMQSGQHEALICAETWERAKQRLDGGAHAPAKENISQDFPLRGFVTCGSCGGGMTSAWSKGRSKHYGYYVCQHRGCASRNKSVRKEKLEAEFLDIVRSLQPAPGLFEMAKDMFKRFWDERIASGASRRDNLSRELANIEREIARLTKRMFAAEIPAAISVYEGEIGKLETKKTVLREQTSKTLEPQKPFDQLFNLAWAFLANPCILWEKGNYDHKRLLLRMAFTDKLAYCRDNGFMDCLNRKIALPFGAYSDFSKKSDMVRTAGLEPAWDFSRQILSHGVKH